jgi:hypothetical protein
VSSRALMVSVALACFLLAPPTAEAATVWRDDGRVIVYAGPGEANRVTVVQEDLGSSDFLRVREAGAGVTLATGSGCDLVGPGDVRCSLPDYFIVYTADGNDSVASEARIGSYLAGGTGDDTLQGGSGEDTVDGQDGSDTLAGGGDDDELKGGAGTDTATYASYSLAVEVDIDGRADDGASGEDDDVDFDVENLVGGAADDRLTGSSGANFVQGGPGRDTVRGEGGNDTLEVRDGEHDDAACGSGQDHALADPGDGLAGDCETVTLATPLVPPPPGAPAQPLRVTRKPVTVTRRGLARMRLRCTRAFPQGCHGKVTLELPARHAKESAARRRSLVLGSRRFRARSGRLTTVNVKLSRNGRRRVLRSRRIRCRASVVVRQPGGAITTVHATVTLTAVTGSAG